MVLFRNDTAAVKWVNFLTLNFAVDVRNNSDVDLLVISDQQQCASADILCVINQKKIDQKKKYSKIVFICHYQLIFLGATIISIILGAMIIYDTRCRQIQQRGADDAACSIMKQEKATNCK